jgi:hypothetical protein
MHYYADQKHDIATPMLFSFVLSEKQPWEGKRKSRETEIHGPQHTVNYVEQHFFVFPRILGFCEKMLRKTFPCLHSQTTWPVTQKQLAPHSTMHAVQASQTKVQMLKHGACN